MHGNPAEPLAPQTPSPSELSDLAAADRELWASILRDSFAHFAAYFWPRLTSLPWPENTATRALVAALQAVADGRIWRLLVAIAPGIGKSSMLALFSAWRLARRGDWRSMHAMHASNDANRESLRVRRLVQHEDFVRLFPHVRLAADEQTVQAWATTDGGRYFCLGTDTAITSKRVLELVVDDPMSANDRRSKTERDRVWTWLDESAKSRLDGDRAPIIIVAQRLDRDDIHARCLASGEAWAFLEPAAARDDRGLELRDHAGVLVWSDDREPDGLIAPQMLGHEKLRALSKAVRTTQYQQRPDEDSGDAAIARSSWRFHAPAGANPRAARPSGCASPEESPTAVTPDHFDRIVISLDPTFGGTKTSNDFASAQVWGASGPGRYLLERWKQRSKQREQRAQLKVFRTRYPSATILIERSAGGDGMIEELTADGVRNIEGVTVGSHTGGKTARLDNVSPTIEQGFTYLPIGMVALHDFVDELAGATMHDDDQDACSQALHWLNVNGSTNALERWKNASKPGTFVRRENPAIAEHADAQAALDRALAVALLPQLEAELAAIDRQRSESRDQRKHRERLENRRRTALSLVAHRPVPIEDIEQLRRYTSPEHGAEASS